MQTPLTLLLILLTNFSQAQSPHQISDTDTTLDYKTRFYKDGVLNLNGYSLYTNDSITYFFNDSIPYHDFKDEKSAYLMDSIKMDEFKSGKWIRHYSLKRKKHYSLAEYADGFLVGKRYDFRKNGTLCSAFKRYPKIKDSTFHGSQIISYHRKDQHITKIEYILFEEDQTNLSFWYSLYYSSQGKLTYYSYYNEKIGTHEFIEYNKKGEIKKEYIRNSAEWYDKKWNSGRTKMKLIKLGKGTKTIEVYRKEKLVRKKVINS